MIVNKDIIIIGENLLGLYTGLRCIEKGFNVIILDKSVKSSYIKHYPLILSENHYVLKRLLTKYNIPLIQTENELNSNEIINTLLLKAEKIPTVLKENISFKQLCLNVLGKNNLYKIIPYLSELSAKDAIIYLKKNYINKNHYILKNNSNILLEKLREDFVAHGGKIEYMSNVSNISYNEKSKMYNVIYNNEMSISSTKVFSTIKIKNLMKIYNFNYDTLNIIKSHFIKKPTIQKNILYNSNMSIPKNIISFNDNISLLNYLYIFGSETKLYIVSNDLSLNHGWINGCLENINDLIKSF